MAQWNKGCALVVFDGLCVNGSPFASRFNTGKSCACRSVGANNPDCLHHVWYCVTAQAVIGELQRGLLFSRSYPGARPCVVNAEVPVEVDEPCTSNRALRQLWKVVCLAALYRNVALHMPRDGRHPEPVQDALQQEAGSSGVGGHRCSHTFQ